MALVVKDEAEGALYQKFMTVFPLLQVYGVDAMDPPTVVGRPVVKGVIALLNVTWTGWLETFTTGSTVHDTVGGETMVNGTDKDEGDMRWYDKPRSVEGNVIVLVPEDTFTVSLKSIVVFTTESYDALVRVLFDPPEIPVKNDGVWLSDALKTALTGDVNMAVTGGLVHELTARGATNVMAEKDGLTARSAPPR